MSEMISVRLRTDVADRLRRRAAEGGHAVSGFAQRLIDEGLRMSAHPGIVFRDGPSGRRAALARGPDVSEVISLLKSLDARGEAALLEAAEWLAVPKSLIRSALAYYGDFSDEIDEEIAASHRSARELQESLGHQDRLLGSPKKGVTTVRS